MFRSKNDLKISGERLTVPLSMEDGTVPGVVRNLLSLVLVLILAVIIWASFAEVRELAITEGTLVPSGSETVVEHLEGGIVEQVLVTEGQLVEIGAPLMRLRAVATASDLEQLAARTTGLRLEKLRATANLADTPPDFGELGAKFPQIASTQMKIFLSQRELTYSRARASAARVARQKAEIAALKRQSAAIGEQLTIQAEQLAMREEMLREGFTSRKDYLDAQSRFRQAQADLAAIDGALAAAREGLAEAQNRASEDKAEARRALLEDDARISRELVEAEQGLLKFRDRSDRLYIRSPIRGTVKELATQSIGKVLRPGDVAARIVPIGERVVAEVQVRPRDIAYVAPGLDAEITITALDPNVHGKLGGRVTRVSPSTFQTDKGETYYRAVIELETVAKGTSALPALLPGMIVQANIVTGAKSVMRYLLKPVVRSLDAAFSER
ncbi:hypothetical protein MNBD_ALPHA09-1245 [hydrothermal vent metagenome]|uniref:Membrane fusion protein (MFP) family protein n=1 Tax=hydrothermal vent metagenome TaxID=652676 RepID=A0A3B0TKE0_9ZZZZ